MIGSLRGVLLDRTAEGEALVEVGGVGYRVTVPARTMAAVGEVGSPVFLHVYTHVRDDAIVLYGFASRDERACFEALLGAHGVGPSLGLAILSAHSPASLARALATDDVDALTVVPGVGKKTAARLLVELKARLDLDLGTVLAAVAHGNGDGTGNGTPNGTSNGNGNPNGSGPPPPWAEVRAALAGLGYGADEVHAAMAGLPDGGAVEELLRQALRHLAVAR